MADGGVTGWPDSQMVRWQGSEAVGWQDSKMVRWRDARREVARCQLARWWARQQDSEAAR